MNFLWHQILDANSMLHTLMALVFWTGLTFLFLVCIFGARRK